MHVLPQGRTAPPVSKKVPPRLSATQCVARLVSLGPRNYGVQEMEQQRHLKTSLSSSHLPKLPSRPPESERGAWLTCFSAFRALIPPRGIIRAFKTPFPLPSPPQKQWRETGAADKWGFLGRKNYASSGGGRRISARCLPQIHIMRRPRASASG